MSKTIGIVGTRKRKSLSDFQACEKVFLSIYEEGDRIVSGGCPDGGDNFAEKIAKKFGITITIHYPNWKKHGKSAGFLRNGAIAEEADILIAVVDPSRKGGTEDTIKKMDKFGKKNKVILVEEVKEYLDDEDIFGKP